MSKILDISRWRQEIEIAEKWKEDNFGTFTTGNHSRAGENIDYYEKGFSSNVAPTNEEVLTTLNLVHSIVKNIVPALYYQNPKVMVFPKKADGQDTAPVVGQIVNYYFKELEIEEINQRIIWDAYVLGHGYCKIGYASTLGTDIPKEQKKKTVIQRGLEALGLKKKEEEEIINTEINMNVISGRPYVMYISPFDFGRDPRANTLEESMYWYHKVKRTVKYMKENKKYKNTSGLTGTAPVDVKLDDTMSQSEIEDFKTVALYELHYRCDNEIYILVISKDSDEYREHYHELSPYQIDGWQVEELTFNKHGHNSFAISDMTKIRNLQDRFTNTFDTILEQVDRFVPKIACNEGDVTQQGMLALRDGDIGAIVTTSKNPAEVFKELNFTQVKADLSVLSEKIIDIVTITTGLTRAQLTGVSTSGTATEATIEQGGQTLRLSDMSRAVSRFSRRQSKKLWQVIRQFVELEDLELINGQTGIDEITGMPIYNWLTVDADKSLKMQVGDYDFDIEVGSTQKPDLGVVRKQFENLFSILARTDVITLMQQQGDKVVLSELLRMYLNLFPEAVKDVGRIVQKITPQTNNLIPPPVDKGGGTTPGSNFNAMEAQAAQRVPTMPNQMEAGQLL